MSNLCCNSFSTLDYNSLQTINGGDTKTGLELLGIAGTIVVGIAAVVVAPAAVSAVAGVACAVGVVAAATCLSVGICELFGHDL